MSIESSVKTTLHCDMDDCLASQEFTGSRVPSRALVERLARDRAGWRKDKLGRNICPAHPRLKGARRA
jgi:hypothetical protein